GVAVEAADDAGVVVERQVARLEAGDAREHLPGRLEAAEQHVEDRRDEDDGEREEDGVAQRPAQRRGADASHCSRGGAPLAAPAQPGRHVCLARHATSLSSRRRSRWTSVIASTITKKTTVIAAPRPTLFSSKAVVTAWYMTVVVASFGPPLVRM